MNGATSTRSRPRRCYGCRKPLDLEGSSPFHDEACRARWIEADRRDEVRTLERVTRIAALPWREEGQA